MATCASSWRNGDVRRNCGLVPEGEAVLPATAPPQRRALSAHRPWWPGSGAGEMATYAGIAAWRRKVRRAACHRPALA